MIRVLVGKFLGLLGYQMMKRRPGFELVSQAEYLIPKAWHGQTVETEDHILLPKNRVTFAHDLLFTFHNCDFIKDQRFKRSYELGRSTDVNGTVLTDGQEIYWRVHVLCWAAAQVKHLPGDFVDCGVNTGIFSRAIINYIDFDQTDKKYYLLDTFEGLDERYSSAEELAQDLNTNYRANKNTLYEQVRATFEGFNVKIIKGAVPDTLPEVESERIAFLSIDMNCVQPEVAALEFFWDRLVPGAMIILDDYGYSNNHYLQKKAHDTFAASKGVEILTLPTCQGMIIKP